MNHLQDRSTRDTYMGVMDCIRKIAAAEGYIGFYKGLAPNIIRVLPGTCITFLVYENLSQFFKRHATEQTRIDKETKYYACVWLRMALLK